MIIIITNNIKDQDLYLLKENNIQYKVVPRLQFPPPLKENSKVSKYLDTINKFYIFTFEDFDKIMYLDTDVIPLNNLDFLFDYFKDKNYEICSFFKRHDDPGIANYLKKSPIGECFICIPNKNKFIEIVEKTKNSTEIGYVDEGVIYYLCNWYGIQLPSEVITSLCHAYAPSGKKMWCLLGDRNWINCYNLSAQQLIQIYNNIQKFMLVKKES